MGRRGLKVSSGRNTYVVREAKARLPRRLLVQSDSEADAAQHAMNKLRVARVIVSRSGATVEHHYEHHYERDADTKRLAIYAIDHGDGPEPTQWNVP